MRVYWSVPKMMNRLLIVVNDRMETIKSPPFRKVKTEHIYSTTYNVYIITNYTDALEAF